MCIYICVCDFTILGIYMTLHKSHTFIIVYFYMSYLFERQRKSESQKKDIFSTCRFSHCLQQPTLEQVITKKTQSRFAMLVASIYVLEPSPVPLRVHISRNLELKAELEASWYGICGLQSSVWITALNTSPNSNI